MADKLADKLDLKLLAAFTTLGLPEQQVDSRWLAQQAAHPAMVWLADRLTMPASTAEDNGNDQCDAAEEEQELQARIEALKASANMYERQRAQIEGRAAAEERALSTSRGLAQAHSLVGSVSSAQLGHERFAVTERSRQLDGSLVQLQESATRLAAAVAACCSSWLVMRASVEEYLARLGAAMKQAAQPSGLGGQEPAAGLLAGQHTATAGRDPFQPAYPTSSGMPVQLSLAQRQALDAELLRLNGALQLSEQQWVVARCTLAGLQRQLECIVEEQLRPGSVPGCELLAQQLAMARRQVDCALQQALPALAAEAADALTSVSCDALSSRQQVAAKQSALGHKEAVLTGDSSRLRAANLLLGAVREQEGAWLQSVLQRVQGLQVGLAAVSAAAQARCSKLDMCTAAQGSSGSNDAFAAGLTAAAKPTGVAVAVAELESTLAVALPQQLQAAQQAAAGLQAAVQGFAAGRQQPSMRDPLLSGHMEQLDGLTAQLAGLVGDLSRTLGQYQQLVGQASSAPLLLERRCMSLFFVRPAELQAQRDRLAQQLADAQARAPGAVTDAATPQQQGAALNRGLHPDLQALLATTPDGASYGDGIH